MAQREEFPREAYQWWIARCDADWKRHQGRWMPVLFVLALVLGILGSDIIELHGTPFFRIYYYKYFIDDLSYSAGLRDLLTPVFFIFSTGIWFGVQRARMTRITGELALPFSPATIVRMHLLAARRALYLTALPLALPAVLLEPTWTAPRMEAPIGYLFGWLTEPLPTFTEAIAAAWLSICCVGFLVCVIEWQALLLSRFPPRRELLWLQWAPCALPLVANWLSTLAVRLVPRLYQYATDDSNYAAWCPLSRFDLYHLALLAGLAVAPWLWRWATSSPWRWAVLTACLLAGMAVPPSYYYPNTIKQPTLLGTALSLCRGAYLGASDCALFGEGMLRRNPFRRAAAALPPKPEAAASGHYSYLHDFKHQQELTPRGPGVVVATGLFLPWYLALPLLVLYYLYCIIVLRRCAARPPTAAL